MDKLKGWGGLPMRIINFFSYNIIIKCQNVDKGRVGGGTSDNAHKDFSMF